MTEPLRVVADTNVIISRVLRPGSQPARAVVHAVSSGRLIVSEATMLELIEVIERPKFDAYLHLDERREFVRQLVNIAEFVPVTRMTAK